MARPKKKQPAKAANRRERPVSEAQSPQRLTPHPQPRRFALLMVAAVAFTLWLGYLVYVASTRF